MPFDGTLVIEKQVRSVTDASLGIGTNSGLPQRASPRAIPPWCVNRRTECVASAVAVLSRARELIADERRWCKRAFAVAWLDIPVHAGSRFARRYCALGAIKRAGRELGLPVHDANRALESQTIIPVAEWNDDRKRTHAEVVVAFDAAIAALDAMPAY
jgi:hypothetical protein